MSAVGLDEGARLFNRPILLCEVRAEGWNVSAVTPDKSLLLLPLVLVAQGSEILFHLTMMVDILAELHLLRGTHASFSTGVTELPAPLKPSHETEDNGQAGIPTHVLDLGKGASGQWTLSP